ncbi:MAG: PaaI family thioesterase [Methanoregula sp.]|jgi:acyl-CoA thioesterase|nr:PaaI family thioesterase [Methanoregula sp.]
MTGHSHEPDEAAIAEQVRIFNESDFARLMDMVIVEARDGYSRVTMDCTGKMNTGGTAHGGAIFTVADQAFGIASNCCGPHRVAVSVSIQYIAPAKGMLVAEARRVEDNGTCDTYRVMVYEGERPVAEFTGVAFRV